MHIGIDLGTTNTIGSYYEGGSYKVIVFENGDHLMPSYVEYKNRYETLCGKPAKMNFRSGTHYVISNAKRLIGRSFNKAEVQK